MIEIDASKPDVAPSAPACTVLCVDDEPNILAALKRTLRGAGFSALTAGGGAEALEILEKLPVDIVVSDMRMPGIDGAQLLEQVHARWPHVVRVLLTGHADQGSTVSAINRGRIFRYLSKPWDERDLLSALHEGADRLALEREKLRLEALTREQNAELRTLNVELEARVTARTQELSEAHEKLKRGYLKSIKVFSNLLELRSGQLAGHGRRVAEVARDLARAMGMAEDEVVHVFVAGLLHDIGLMGMNDALLARPVMRYSAEEMTQYRSHTQVGEQSLLALDEMQPVLPIIRGHHERHDGAGFPDKLAGAAIPLGARILAIADAYDDLQIGHVAEVKLSAQEARILMRKGRGSQFDPEVLDVFLQSFETAAAAAAGGGAQSSMVLTSAALESDMVLAKDLVSARGILMLTAGHRLTNSLIRKIREFELREGSKLEVHIKPKGKS
jgi:response regulator RpfG family c-di-GMP phosphodiesterase